MTDQDPGLNPTIIMPVSQADQDAAYQRGMRRVIGIGAVSALGVASLFGGEALFSGHDSGTNVSNAGLIVNGSDASAPVLDAFNQGDKPCGRVISRADLIAFTAAHPELAQPTRTKPMDF